MPLAWSYLDKCDFARIGNHSQRRDDLFLNISLDWFARFSTRVEQLE